MFTSTVSLASAIIRDMSRKELNFQYGRIEDMSDFSDIHYWQQQSDEKKFAEAWRLVELAYEMKGLSKDELRFQRTVASLQCRKS